MIQIGTIISIYGEFLAVWLALKMVAMLCTRLKLVLTALLLIVCGSCISGVPYSTLGKSEESKPNFVIILADDVSWYSIACVE